jgi:hypothetical protein
MISDRLSVGPRVAEIGLRALVERMDLVVVHLLALFAGNMSFGGQPAAGPAQRVVGGFLLDAAG